MPTVDFYFDYACPWSYIAFVRLVEATTRTGARIDWKPFSAPAASLRLDAEPARAGYQRDDLLAWAHYCDVSLRLPATTFVDSAPALRGAIAAIAAGRARAYSDAVFKAAFCDGLDIADTSVIASLAATAGIDVAAVTSAQTSAEAEQALANNADTLANRGGFRSPTMFVGEQMFAGPSRMPLVEYAIGQASDRIFVVPGGHG